MTKPVSSFYHYNFPANLKKRISQIVEKGCRKSKSTPRLFFRADDIGYMSKEFHLLISCFAKHRLPLCLATVPSWLTTKQLTEIHQITGSGNGQYYWHQHGRLHRNFEQTGRKQEFGPARSRKEILASLSAGRKRLEQLLDTDFHPVFTPPWNRCSTTTLHSLTELDYIAVSRSVGAAPPSPEHLLDFQVGVDLHTRKEQSPVQALNNLFAELENSLTTGLCGIMIHHQRMNRRAFTFLDFLLDEIGKSEIVPAHFGDLVSEMNRHSSI